MPIDRIWPAPAAKKGNRSDAPTLGGTLEQRKAKKARRDDDVRHAHNQGSEIIAFALF